MLSYLEISQSSLLNNIKEIRSYIHPETNLLAVVKGNAYGCGLKEIVSVVESEVDMYGVDDVEDLRALRKISDKKTLILGYIQKKELQEVISFNNVDLGVYSTQQVKNINKAAQKHKKTISIHLKIDALLGRQGILPDKLNNLIEAISSCDNIQLKAVYTHFSNIEDTISFSHAQQQIEILNEAHNSLKKRGFNTVSSHISSTSGILAYEKNKGVHSLVRLGVGLYGLWPSEHLKDKLTPHVNFKPIVRWVTHVAQIKTLPKGFPVGYGRTHITENKTKIAIIPQGYCDGYDRGLSNKGEVLIHGKRCRVLGRVAMNMFVVDVSHLDNISVEDEVVLLGRQDDDEITTEEIAEKIKTINYEVIARISPLLPRKLVK